MTQLPDATDVATILEALRQEVRAARAAQGEGEAGTALGAIERELHHCAEQLEITRVVSAHWPLEGGGLYERAWALVHKVVRRGLSWYIPPIVEQQNAFNEAAARAIRLLIESQAELRDQLAELRPEQGGGGQEAGDQGAGDQEAGDQETGDQETGDQEAGDQETGDQETGDQETGDQETGDQEAGDQEAGDQETGDQETRRPGGEPGAEARSPGPGTATPADPRLREAAAALEARASVSAHWDLGGATPVARARGLAQRGVRQYLRWMVNPIVEQQNAANAAIAGAVPHLAAADAELRARAARS